MLDSLKQRSRVAPRPFPYNKHPVNRYGFSCFADMSAESEHIAIGRDGWVPFAYAVSLCHLGHRGSGALARYLDLARAYDGLGALEDWPTCDKKVKAAWLARLEYDHAMFEPFKLPYDNNGAMAALRDLLFALMPPHKGIVLCCSQEFADWHRLPQNKAYYDGLHERYDWLLGQVSDVFKQAGFEVDGPLFKFEGFEALYHDDWTAFDF